MAKPVRNRSDVVDNVRAQRSAQLTADDAERLGGLATMIEGVDRAIEAGRLRGPMDPDGREVRYLRSLSRAAKVVAADMGDPHIWVCERGHVDDHHIGDVILNPSQYCSRCGGRCHGYKGLDEWARAHQDALRALADLTAKIEEAKEPTIEQRVLGGELDGAAEVVSEASAKPLAPGLNLPYLAGLMREASRMIDPSRSDAPTRPILTTRERAREEVIDQLLSWLGEDGEYEALHAVQEDLERNPQLIPKRDVPLRLLAALRAAVGRFRDHAEVEMPDGALGEDVENQRSAAQDDNEED